MRENGLAGDRGQCRELPRREPHPIERVAPRVGHVIQHRFLWGCGKRTGLAEMRDVHADAPLAAVELRAYRPGEQGEQAPVKLVIALAAALLLAAPAVAGEAPPLIDEPAAAAIAAEVSGSSAKRTVVALSVHHRMRGSRGYDAAAAVIADRLAADGLAEVR